MTQEQLTPNPEENLRSFREAANIAMKAWMATDDSGGEFDPAKESFSKIKDPDAQILLTEVLVSRQHILRGMFIQVLEMSAEAGRMLIELWISPKRFEHWRYNTAKQIIGAIGSGSLKTHFGSKEEYFANYRLQEMRLQELTG